MLTSERNDRDRPAAPGVTGGAAPPRRAPLVGRHDIRQRFGRVLAAGAGGLALHGRAGAGKTRLAEELVGDAEADGRFPIFARCRAVAVDLPLGAFAHVLPPDLIPMGPGLLVQARHAVLDLAAGRPIVLGVDDVQFIDPASALLVAQLVRTTDVITVLTHVAQEWVPDVVAELWHDGTLQRVVVDQLERDDTIAMAEALLGDRLADDAAELLWTLTHGSPLFVHLLAHESGVDTPTRAAIEQALDASLSLADYVAARIGALGAAEAEAMRLVALGEPIDATILEALVPIAVLRALEERNYLVLADSPSATHVRLAHPLYGEVIRRTTSRFSARSAYRQFAETALTGRVRADQTVRVAAWALDGGGEAPASLLLDAAQQAMHSADASLSERLARHVWERERDLQAGLILASVLDDCSNGDEAAGLFDELRQRAASGTGAGGEVAAMITTLEFRHVYWRRGDAHGARTVLRAAGPEPATAPAEVQTLWATFHALAGDFDACRAIVHEVLAGPPGRATIAACFAGALAELSNGRPVEAAELTDQLIAALDAAGSQVAMFSPQMAPSLRVPLLLQLGRVTDAVAVGEAAVAAAESIGVQLPIGQSLFNHAGALVWAGRPAAALRHVKRALSVFRTTGHRTFARNALCMAAFAAGTTGAVDIARTALDRVAELDPNPTSVMDGLLWVARGDIARHGHDPAGAAAMYRDGAAWTRARGLAFEEAVLWHRLLRLGFAGEVAEPLAELAAGRDGIYRLLADHADGLHRNDVALLGATAHALWNAGAAGLAVEVASDAAAVAGRSDRRAATRWAALAHEWAAACDEVVAPASMGAMVVPLSRREREVAEMAASGLSSPDIAERLFLSTRTVENHLARAYTKLGVRTRAELATMLTAPAAR